MRGSGSRAERGSARGLVLIAAVWLITTALWLTPGITRPDGAGYFAYLPSTWIDHDLLFFDEWARLGLIRDGRILFKDVTATQHLSNHWTAGTSLAWYPAYVGVDLVARGNGFATVYVAAVAFTSALAGLFVLWAGWRLSGNAWAAIAIWLGSPLAFYALRHATMSHAISAAACTAVVLLALRVRDATTPARVFAAGMAIGFACAVRPQNATIILVPLLIAPAAIKRAHFLFAGALLAALPQLIVSQVLWGAPLAFVNIGAKAHPWQMFATFRPLETLFSWYHGLATWTPLLVLAIAGLCFVRDRALARAGLLMFVSQWLVLSLLERWFWGGLSFGQRRFDSCTIFFIVGLAALLERLPKWLGVLLTIATSAWTTLLLIAAPRLNLNRYQSPGELLEAIRLALPDRAWRSLLGYTPPALRTDVLIAAAVTLAVLALLALLARSRYASALAAAYLVLMSGFYAWCGLHPKHDAFTRAILATPMPSGSAQDTITLLRYEADYMARTGRPEEARKALAEAAAIRP